MAKTKFRNEYIAQIRWMARAGLTDDEMATELGVSRSTFSRWKVGNSNFMEALKLGKDVIDNMVEDALFKKALGGDTVACIFWLKNRRPDRWRDRHELDGDISIKGPLVIERNGNGNGGG
jgi:DNA-binding XRE family transcriptional regulator